jgi:hypothetical protein
VNFDKIPNLNSEHTTSDGMQAIVQLFEVVNTFYKDASELNEDQISEMTVWINSHLRNKFYIPLCIITDAPNQRSDSVEFERMMLKHIHENESVSFFADFRAMISITSRMTPDADIIIVLRVDHFQFHRELGAWIPIYTPSITIDLKSTTIGLESRLLCTHMHACHLVE